MRGLGLAVRMLAVSLMGLSLCLWMAEGAFSAPKKAPKPAAPVVQGEDIPIEDEGARPPMAPAGEAEAPQARPVPPTAGAPAPVTLTAYLSDGNAPMTSGAVWRIYQGRAARDGSYKLLDTLHDAQPTVDLKPGEYLINVSYGRANLTKKLGVWPEKPVKEDFVINAGGLRINATQARQPIQAEHLLKFELFAESQDQFGGRHKVLDSMRPGVVIRLNSGIYHVVSTFGDANSTVSTDVVVEPGKITEAGIDHDAGKVTLKLVQQSGGEAAADTHWIVYNAVGEVIKESAGAFPAHILAVGEYRVAAQHGDQQYAGAFTVAAGETKLVEVLMQ